MGSGSDEGIRNTRTYRGNQEVKGTKNDSNKPAISLIPKDFLEETAAVFTFGAAKYGKHNFKQGIEISRTIDAAFRHLLAFNEGQDLDSESKLSHLGHAAASIAMTIYNLKNNPQLDDRYRKPSAK